MSLTEYHKSTLEHECFNDVRDKVPFSARHIDDVMF